MRTLHSQDPHRSHSIIKSKARYVFLKQSFLLSIEDCAIAYYSLCIIHYALLICVLRSVRHLRCCVHLHRRGLRLPSHATSTNLSYATSMSLNCVMEHCRNDLQKNLCYATERCKNVLQKNLCYAGCCLSSAGEQRWNCCLNASRRMSLKVFPNCESQLSDACHCPDELQSGVCCSHAPMKVKNCDRDSSVNEFRSGHQSDDFLRHHLHSDDCLQKSRACALRLHRCCRKSCVDVFHSEHRALFRVIAQCRDVRHHCCHL